MSEETQASGPGRDEWTMTGTLDLHGTPMPFESHWVRREWADAEIERLRRELAQEKHRSFQDSRISYRGFSYGVGSQWGIDSLRRAIERNDHG